MTDTPSKSDWETLAAKESRGKDLSRETVEGIRLETVYGPDDAGIDSGYPGVGEAFTMLTTEPGEDVRPYHNRQVVVLPPAEFGRWLDPAVPAREVLKPAPPESLKVEQIC